MPITVRLRILPAGSWKRAAVAFLHLRRLVIRADAQALLVFLLPLGLAARIAAAACTARAFAGPARVLWHGGLRSGCLRSAARRVPLSRRGNDNRMVVCGTGET